MTDFPQSLRFVWSEDDSFRPASPFWHRLAQENLEHGKAYYLKEDVWRSDKSHRHYHACIRELWKNLPDTLAAKYPSDTHLRKHALIVMGYYNERQFACESRLQAHKLVEFLKSHDETRLFSLNDNIVIERSAKSQKVRSMDKDEFQKSKNDVIEYLCQLTGVDPEELKRHAEQKVK